MLHSGGPERWLMDLCQGGPSENLDMDVAVLWDMDGLFARKSRELKIPVFFCEGRTNPLKFILNLRRIIREQGPYDAIHSHLHAFSALVVLAARLEKIPARVVHSHNVVTQTSSLARRAYVGLARTLIRTFATAGLAPAIGAMDSLMGPRWREDSRWSVMRCGISLEPFRAPIPQTVSRASFGIPEDALVIGTVGRLCAEKNSEFMVDVLGEVLRRHANSYLLMLGEGPLKQTLEAKAEKGGFRNHLVLAGVRADVADVLRAAVDVFSLPSPPPPRGNEALPIAVIEAQACGLPTVISDGVTTESIIVPDLVVRIPEAAGPVAWAETLIEHAGRRQKNSATAALAIMDETQFNCTQNLKMLASLYRDPSARKGGHLVE